MNPPTIATQPLPTPIRQNRGFGQKLLACTIIVGLLLGGCASPYVGVSVPVGPVSVGVGASKGGLSAGVGTGVGPVGVGVGVNQRGQVTGSAGVGASTRVGSSNARVGAGVGTSAVIYDPQQQRSQPAPRPPAPSAPQPSPQQQPYDGAQYPHPQQMHTPQQASPSTFEAPTNGSMHWHDASGNAVPACQVNGGC